MIIKNAMLEHSVCDILIEKGKIKGIGAFSGEDVIDAHGHRVIPGMIDTHIHGFGGYDVTDGRLEDISIALAKCGTTSWTPTAMTYDDDTLRSITSSDIDVKGAEILGFHLEGPYISAAKKGAQNEKWIRKPDIAEFDGYKNVIKVTVAPEVDGASEFIKNARCLVSIGHTDCTYEQALEAIDAGANCLTHTFNAMPPMLHRAPGPIGAAFEKGIYAEVICDGRHVSQPAVLAIYKMFGADRMMLISDALPPAGLPDGKYSNGGLAVFMRDGKLTLADGTLAGGSVPLFECVKTAVGFGIPFYDAVKMATATPAASLGINKGSIKEGYDADLLMIDGDMNIETVIIGGNII